MRRPRPAARARAAPGVAGAGTPAALVNRPQSCARAPPPPARAAPGVAGAGTPAAGLTAPRRLSAALPCARGRGGCLTGRAPCPARGRLNAPARWAMAGVAGQVCSRRASTGARAGGGGPSATSWPAHSASSSRASTGRARGRGGLSTACALCISPQPACPRGARARAAGRPQNANSPPFRRAICLISLVFFARWANQPKACHMSPM